MAAALIRTSAPGKLMILGEHGVLAGARSLVAAVNKRIHVELRPRSDHIVQVQTEYGLYQSSLHALQPDARFRFVIAAVQSLADELPSGVELLIRSEFSHQVGLGSSAAVTAAVTAALLNWRQKNAQLKDLFASCLRIVHDVQGAGSGADVAASLFGGLVLYRADPLTITPIAVAPPLTVVYCGYKTPTVQVIDSVKARQQQFPDLFRHLYDAMDAISAKAESAVRMHDWSRLGMLMNLNQGLLNAIGVSSADLEEIVDRLRNDDAIYGAKISGSGLGDCVLALGAASEQTLHRFQSPRQVLPIAVSLTGLEVA